MREKSSFILINREKKPTLSLSPDHILVTPNENGSITIDTIRSLKEWAYLKPFSQDEKIAVIVDAQQTTIEAQNALLKLLEEPPRQTILLLHIDDEKNVLPTILSRCEHITALTEFSELIRWDESAREASSAHHLLFTVDSLFNDDQISYKDRFDGANEISNFDRQEIITLLDQTVTAIHRSQFSHSERAADLSQKLLEAKIQLIQNANTKLALENLLLKIYGT
ncbi:hypothetical protein KC571_01920 [candidate division WWE3 bacterium]|uniref:DNA polymerase III subunit delta n=1 Tax=candidate division WWE3 bacterium TaxID=2053526 RepID=A0A955LGS1_UNCKA|nr:hypothetical protein [candidate division WWE3 bacterium]